MEFLDHFFEQFEIRLASSEADKIKIYKLRYDVFLQELEYDLSGMPDQEQERDEFDEISAHIIISCRKTQQLVGTARIVMPQTKITGVLSNLPVEKYCGQALHSNVLDLNAIPREQICEISRIVVARHYRKKDFLTEKKRGREDMAATYRLLGLALYVSSAIFLNIMGRPHVMGFIEKKFARLLRGTGMKIERVSGFYHICGLRAAYYGNTEDSLKDMSPAFTGMYEKIKGNVDFSTYETFLLCNESS